MSEHDEARSVATSARATGRVLLPVVALLTLAACVAPPPPVSPPIAPPTTAPPTTQPPPPPAQTAIVSSAFGFGNPTNPSPWDVFIESDGPCRLLGYEVNGTPLPFMSPFPSEQAKTCFGSGSPGNFGFWTANTTFDISVYVSAMDPTNGTWTTDWNSILDNGFAVVQMQDGSVQRLPLPAVCAFPSDNFAECRN